MSQQPLPPLSPRSLDTAFPFHVVCTQDGEVLHMGPGLRERIEPGRPTEVIEEIFAILRPLEGDPLDPDLETNVPWMFELLPGHLRLRGTVLHQEDAVWFLTTPAILSPDELAEVDIAIDELPGHDGTADHLSEVQTLHTSLTETKAMVDKLRRKNVALSSAREESDAAHEAQSRFLATMSHEIRTPLTALLGLAELLENEVASHEHRRMASTIRRSGRLLMSVLDDVLDYARMENAGVELAPTLGDPREPLKSSVEIYGAEARHADLTLTWTCRGEVPDHVMVDHARVSQILGNLVGNALKFTRWGAVHLSVRCEETPGGHELTYSVSDSGVGISKERLASIFEPFEQGDDARRAGGAGLGLAISRRLADQMGGNLTAVSAPGIGSTFRLTVPVHVVESAHLSPVVAAADLSRSLEGRSILIVDDNSVNRFVVRKLLYSLGAEMVDEVSGGQEALDYLAGNDVDVVLLDIEMPGMDGYDTCRHLRRRETSSTRRLVIALSAYALPEYAERAREVGIDDYMHKPTTRTALATTLLSHLDVLEPAVV